MDNTTINGIYTLPTEGKIYTEEVSPTFEIRSMTTNEEMKRLNHSERPYEAMAGIIDACLVKPIGISAYDMHLADYQYLMHKLRVVTYGSSYSLSSTCPYCNSNIQDDVNLDELPMRPLDVEKFNQLRECDLPKSGKHITLKMQTPRLLDNITVRAKEMRRKNPKLEGDPAFLLTLEALIDTIDGKPADPVHISQWIRNLPMMDTNLILDNASEMVNCFGLETDLVNTCPVCGLEFHSSFRVTREFFRPTVKR